MGKGSKQRGNREAKKPKADKKLAPAASSTFLRPQADAPKPGTKAPLRKPAWRASLASAANRVTAVQVRGYRPAGYASGGDNRRQGGGGHTRTAGPRRRYQEGRQSNRRRQRHSSRPRQRWQPDRLRRSPRRASPSGEAFPLRSMHGRSRSRRTYADFCNESPHIESENRLVLLRAPPSSGTQNLHLPYLSAASFGGASISILPSNRRLTGGAYGAV